ncbi:MarR family winged helix-turn-helix transcriptional regulator [Nitrospirillum viridazoti]|uniref:MarR family transcriptional regulator n=1 Tax=Nitrospirillum viridazoti CBAmc TaxID=1441467 RepID=A0A248JYC3_9PROT|nr:MarR family transcriptional regulator [Nitrospirillum amazonense]ASG23204.1 MarR family transcriptional regulator [Nitrospirillum amazonense CBAmc]TWB38960.1 DNA-binding MarR family transcriptional regulator [Nitrospirillum amazonense]
MPPGDTPSDLHAHLGYWLRMVSNAVSQSFARAVEARGVTVAEWVLLRVLYDVERLAPSVLAERMGMTKGAISKLADRLVEKGLVRREANLEDRRGQTLALEPAARSLVPLLAELADRNDAAFFNGLLPNERAQLKGLLHKIASKHELNTAPID